MRRRFLRAFLGLATMFLLVALAAIAGMVAVTSRLLGDGPTAPAVVAAVALLVLGVTALVGIGVVLARRFASPLADVMAAAEQVRAGATDVHVTPKGPRDVRRLATGFNEMVARLDSDERRRRALLADLAHELRTPLTVVRGNVEGMLDGVYEPDAERLRTVVDEVAVIQRLLDDLTILSKSDAGVLQLEIEEVDPRTVVAASVRVVADRARDAAVEVTTRTNGVPATIEADPVRIEQVIVNLLTNAVRHTPAGGSVSVTAASYHDGLRISVADTGAGIPTEDLPHVFDRFVRSADSGGSGLGLAIARRLVEAHGGTITARQGERGGTVVTFTVPRDVGSA